MQELRGNDAVPATHAVFGLRVVGHMEFLNRANMVDISGTVGGKEYAAACTLGDGACALHAVFGVPAIDSGRIACLLVRTLLVDLLPKTLEDLAKSPEAYLYELAEGILNNIWCDFISPAARSVVKKPTAVLKGDESRYWQELPHDNQEELKTVMKTRLAVEEELDTLYAQVFVAEKEKHLVRRLAIRLGYLTTESIEFLTYSANELEAVEHEGYGCSLELLHATAGDASLTKYRALFAQEDAFGIYRRAFFCNTDLDKELLHRIVKDFAGTITKRARGPIVIQTSQGTNCNKSERRGDNLSYL